METIVVAREEDIKKWIKDVISETLAHTNKEVAEQQSVEPLISRDEIAAYLDNISLVTLHAWMKKGLPFHKIGGRVYFLRSEVLLYVTQQKKIFKPE